MEPEDYSKAARRTEPLEHYTGAVAERAQDPELLRLLHHAMGLSTEANELLDVLKAALVYGQPIDWLNVREELGDLCWYLDGAIATARTSWAAVMARNIDKLRARYPDGFTEADAQERDLGAEREAMEEQAAADADERAEPTAALASVDVRGDLHRLAAAIDEIEHDSLDLDKTEQLVDAARSVGGAILRGVADDWHATQVALAESERVPDVQKATVARGERVHVIFDGPPGPESGRFVEVEDDRGNSIRAGEWSKRRDGLWVLSLDATVAEADKPSAAGGTLTQEALEDMRAAFSDALDRSEVFAVVRDLRGLAAQEVLGGRGARAEVASRGANTLDRVAGTLDRVLQALPAPLPTGGTVPDMGRATVPDGCSRVRHVASSDPLGGKFSKALAEFNEVLHDEARRLVAQALYKTADDPTGYRAAPDRYIQQGRETIDRIRDVLGDEGFIAFCHGSSLKYRDRAGAKGDPEGDADKARWYTQMARHVEGVRALRRKTSMPDGEIEAIAQPFDPRRGRPNFTPYCPPEAS